MSIKKTSKAIYLDSKNILFRKKKHNVSLGHKLTVTIKTNKNFLTKATPILLDCYWKTSPVAQLISYISYMIKMVSWWSIQKIHRHITG